FEERDEHVDTNCFVNAFRMGQVFRNLFENAFAARSVGLCVVLKAGYAQLAGRPALEMSIRDNGPGLQAEQRQRIFEPFYTTKTKGTGLGMAIVHRIMEAHGGQIVLGEDRTGGATFVLRLPREVT